MHNNDPHVPNDAQDRQGDLPGDLGSENAELEALHSQLAALEASHAELRETVLRERAELENQRRRMHRDLEQARRFANETQYAKAT